MCVSVGVFVFESFHAMSIGGAAGDEHFDPGERGGPDEGRNDRA